MMYPKADLACFLLNHPEHLQSIWKALKSIPVQHLIGEGRVYGDGLHKLEPKELANASAEEILKIIDRMTE